MSTVVPPPSYLSVSFSVFLRDLFAYTLPPLMHLSLLAMLLAALETTMLCDGAHLPPSSSTFFAEMASLRFWISLKVETLLLFVWHPCVDVCVCVCLSVCLSVRVYFFSQPAARYSSAAD